MTGDSDIGSVSGTSRPYQKVAGVIVVLSLLSLFIFLQFSDADADIDRLLNITAAAITKNCPVYEDATTRLDNAAAAGARKIQYNYTLTDMVRDSIEVEMLYVSFEAAMINNAKKNPALDLFRKNGVTMVYSFRDKAGTFLTKIEITPDKYRN